jgi:carbamoyl-phosphate synthase large subunit
MPLLSGLKKVMVIGSGPIVIGQAAEFDYAGTQACRVLKEAGINVVLVNSNPATIMTDKIFADKIYMEPLTAATVKRIIMKEKPDGLLAGFGGQVGLTLAMKLHSEGFLVKHNIKLLGTDAEAINKAEDRQLFKNTMIDIGQPVIASDTANSLDEAISTAEAVGYPVIVRPAFTLGGTGGGAAFNEKELEEHVLSGLNASPIRQVLIEKYIYGWKEIEFEAVRDSKGNVVIVCSMENFDPVGVHTGDSIVVAPALSLSQAEYDLLKNAAVKIVSRLNIVGACNCQFALKPGSLEYAVIEVNPRVSRSSALASKAAGYPIAKITALISLGYTLEETAECFKGLESACKEPVLDYVVVKLPKWSFEKFTGASRLIGTQMKATGEVMAAAPGFEAALMKAVRGAELGIDTLNGKITPEEVTVDKLKIVDDLRLFTVFKAIKQGMPLETISKTTCIDIFFLNKLKKLADYENSIEGRKLDFEAYMFGKKLGYTDKALERISGSEITFGAPCGYRKFACDTPYYYSVYHDTCEADSNSTHRDSGKPVILVLGSGPIRIGQGIEFDYSTVHCAFTLKKLGCEVVIVNNNPETVSTDYDISDRLYFEPLCPEDVMNIIKAEKPAGVVVAFGGQTAIKLTKFLHEKGIPILGTSAEGIDLAEDRKRFDALLNRLGMKRPAGRCVMTKQEAVSAANGLGYPVLLRPSYVIGGENMVIANSDEEVEIFMERILNSRIENPVLIDKYMMGLELEVDAVSDGKDVFIPGIMEHIERAGVHSGDSIAVYPPRNIDEKMAEEIKNCTVKLALSLGTKGLVNIQYLIYDGQLYVIEVNPRASRTIPFISKITGVPMVDIASKVMLGYSLKSLGLGTQMMEPQGFYAVKVPVFSFEKISDANSFLGPEMKSTGEVLGIGRTINEALFKGLTAAGIGFRMPMKNKSAGVMISVDNYYLNEIDTVVKKFHKLGFKLYATRDTAEAIEKMGIPAAKLESIRKSSQVFTLLEKGEISYIIYTGAALDSTVDDYKALHQKAMKLSIPCFTSLDTANVLADALAGGYTEENTKLMDINSICRKY